MKPVFTYMYTSSHTHVHVYVNTCINMFLECHLICTQGICLILTPPLFQAPSFPYNVRPPFSREVNLSGGRRGLLLCRMYYNYAIVVVMIPCIYWEPRALKKDKDLRFRVSDLQYCIETSLVLFSESPLDSWLSLRAVHACICDKPLNVLRDTWLDNFLRVLKLNSYTHEFKDPWK